MTINTYKINTYKLLVLESWPDGSVKYREWSDGLKCWYKKEKVHKEDGPAVINDIAKFYYLNGEYFPNIKTDEEWIIKQIIE